MGGIDYVVLWGDDDIEWLLELFEVGGLMLVVWDDVIFVLLSCDGKNMLF